MKQSSKQVVRNLLSNAAKFTDAGGTVSLSVREDGDAVEIEVRDTGIGMTSDGRRDRAHALRASRLRLECRDQGSGIGLPLAKAFVELHGGALYTAERAGPRVPWSPCVCH